MHHSFFPHLFRAGEELLKMWKIFLGLFHKCGRFFEKMVKNIFDRGGFPTTKKPLRWIPNYRKLKFHFYRGLGCEFCDYSEWCFPVSGFISVWAFFISYILIILLLAGLCWKFKFVFVRIEIRFVQGHWFACNPGWDHWFVYGPGSDLWFVSGSGWNFSPLIHDYRKSTGVNDFQLAKMDQGDFQLAKMDRVGFPTTESRLRWISNYRNI